MNLEEKVELRKKDLGSVKRVFWDNIGKSCILDQNNTLVLNLKGYNDKKKVFKIKNIPFRNRLICEELNDSTTVVILEKGKLKKVGLLKSFKEVHSVDTLFGYENSLYDYEVTLWGVDIHEFYSDLPYRRVEWYFQVCSIICKSMEEEWLVCPSQVYVQCGESINMLMQSYSLYKHGITGEEGINRGLDIINMLPQNGIIRSFESKIVKDLYPYQGNEVLIDEDGEVHIYERYMDWVFELVSEKEIIEALDEIDMKMLEEVQYGTRK